MHTDTHMHIKTHNNTVKGRKCITYMKQKTSGNVASQYLFLCVPRLYQIDKQKNFFFNLDVYLFIYLIKMLHVLFSSLSQYKKENKKDIMRSFSTGMNIIASFLNNI